MEKNVRKKEIGGKFFVLIVGLFLILLTSCGTNRAAENNPNNSNVDNLIKSGKFEIVHEWAMPLGGNMINLIGNPNFIRLKEDSLDVFLPYFGVRHSGGGYGSEGGIKYEGPAKNLSITHDDRRNTYMMKFEGNQDSENLRFMVTIFPNGETNTSVNSSQRNTISYRGKLRPIKEEE